MKKRIEIVDLIRGVASLTVCLSHLIPLSGIITGNPLRLLRAYSWLGVIAFFVISGFILPFALWRGNYKLSSYGTFVLKRVVRLDPPYFLSIVLIMVLVSFTGWVSNLDGISHVFSIPQVITHLGYFSVFFGYPWINDGYWTLAIEFQYYLLLGLVFPFLAHGTARIRYTSLIVIVIMIFLFPRDGFVFHWGFLFIFGLNNFYLKAGYIYRYQFFALLAAIACGSYLTLGKAVTGVALLTSFFIAFAQVENKMLRFLGDVSYSLYLTHLPIGGGLILLARSQEGGYLYKVVILLAALGLSIVFAYLMTRLIEKPAQRLSSRITYTNAQTFCVL